MFVYQLPTVPPFEQVYIKQGLLLWYVAFLMNIDCFTNDSLTLFVQKWVTLETAGSQSPVELILYRVVNWFLEWFLAKNWDKILFLWEVVNESVDGAIVF